MFYKRNKDGLYRAVCSICGNQYGGKYKRALEAFQFAKDTVCICGNCEKAGHTRKLDRILTSKEKAELKQMRYEEQKKDAFNYFKKCKCIQAVVKDIGISAKITEDALLERGFIYNKSRKTYENKMTGETIKTRNIEMWNRVKQEMFDCGVISDGEISAYSDLLENKILKNQFEEKLMKRLKKNLDKIKKDGATGGTFKIKFKREIISVLLRQGYKLELKLTNPETNEEIIIPTSSDWATAERYII